jgi:hypothetical protein
VDGERAELLAALFEAHLVWNEGHNDPCVTFAFDRPQIEKIYRRGFELLIKAGLKPRQIHSFVLTGFDTMPEEDIRRIEVLRELGAYPFVMVYEPIHGEDYPEFYKRGGALPAVVSAALETLQASPALLQPSGHLEVGRLLRAV